MDNNCLICERIKGIQNGKNPYFVKELKSGYVVIGDYQSYKGYTLLLCKKHIDELHKLNETTKIQFLKDLSLVGEAVFNAFKPDKLNYELLGNTDRHHLHWHIFPRRSSDPEPKGGVWLRGRDAVYSEDSKPKENELQDLRNKLLKELNRLLGC